MAILYLIIYLIIFGVVVLIAVTHIMTVFNPYLIFLYAFCVFYKFFYAISPYRFFVSYLYAFYINISCVFSLHQFLHYCFYEYSLLSACKFSFFHDFNTNPKEDQVFHYYSIIHRIISLYLFVFSQSLECSLTVIICVI